MKPFTRIAIEKAIEGGWKPHNGNVSAKEFIDNKTYLFKSERCLIFLDPFFWQALGKAEEWSISRIYWVEEINEHNDRTEYRIFKRWENEMHSFVDFLVRGFNADEFFKKILTK